MPDPGLRVLVVEDNEPSLELAREVLEDAGFVVHGARDSIEAMAVVDAHEIDGVLLDMNLPGTDGLTLARELRRKPGKAGLTIIAVTAHAMRGDRERFLAAGCDGYIPKPIKVNEFAAEVTRQLAGLPSPDPDRSRHGR